MQCDPTCSNYSPCISSCPLETCDNILQTNDNQMCKEENCVEGCEIKKCQEGFVYSNNTFQECVPKSICKPICLTVNGVIYYEGDIISSDSCHTCTCTRGNKMCIGIPCMPKIIASNEVDLKFFSK